MKVEEAIKVKGVVTNIQGRDAFVTDNRLDTIITFEEQS